MGSARRRLLRLAAVLTLAAAAGLVAGGAASGSGQAASAVTVSSSIHDGQTLSGRVHWTATVAGLASGATARVEFSIDGALKWTERTAPYAFNGDSGSLDTTKLTNGTHSFGVRAVASDGSTASATASAKVANPVAPKNTAKPAISGDARRGSTLTASTGSWSGTTPFTFSYHWLRCNTSGRSCSRISGATAQTYVLGRSDVDHRLRVTVRASNAAGASEATSGSTAVVAAGSAPVNTAPPKISGTAQVGQTLTVSPGSWTSDSTVSFTYQWQRCTRDGGTCSSLGGATRDRYTPVDADVGARIAVLVTAGNSAGKTSVRSAPTEAVSPAGAVKTGTGASSIPVESIPRTERLVIDRVSSRVTSRGLVARVRVRDTRGFVVRGALVYVLGIPYGRVRTPPERPTGADGTVSFLLKPLARPARRGRSILLFVRARRQGDSLLAGISTRRLVQVPFHGR